MDVLGQLSGVVGIFVLGTLGIVAYQRSLDKPGGRDGLGSFGDAFNPVNEIFHPAQHQATEDLKRQEEKGEVAPSPDDEDEPVRLITNPDGTPHRVRIRRPRPPVR